MIEFIVDTCLLVMKSEIERVSIRRGKSWRRLFQAVSPNLHSARTGALAAAARLHGCTAARMPYTVIESSETVGTYISNEFWFLRITQSFPNRRGTNQIKRCCRIYIYIYIYIYIVHCTPLGRAAAAAATAASDAGADCSTKCNLTASRSSERIPCGSWPFPTN